MGIDQHQLGRLRSRWRDAAVLHPLDSGAMAEGTTQLARMRQWLIELFQLGAFRVAALSLLIICFGAWATWHWWCFLSFKDTPTNAIRNVALIGGGLIAWIFAFWRSSIAERQADIAKQEHHHGRFQSAIELLAKEGRHNGHARLSGLHALRYLTRDEPAFGPDVIEVVTTFMLEASTDQEYVEREEREFTLARLTAEFVCDTLDRERRLDVTSRRRLREDVARACAEVARKLSEREVPR